MRQETLQGSTYSVGYEHKSSEILRDANPFRVYESACVLAQEVLPLVPEIKKQYTEVAEELFYKRDFKTYQLMKSPEKAMIVNLAAAGWALKTDLKDMRKRGVLVPAVLMYRGLADFWDDEVDFSPQMQKEDPVVVLWTGKGGKAFGKGISMLYESGLINEEEVGNLVQGAEQYVRTEHSLLGSGDLEKMGYSKDEVIEFVAVKRLESFGQMAWELTHIMAKNGKLTYEERMEAAEKMKYFAIFGGIIDDYKDSKEYKNKLSKLLGFRPWLKYAFRALAELA